uniref:Uncharacterized protein n=1 Tax=Tanacetum cinerariifolium TaxID=118510 RepID=A0A6L2M4B0_TANCI|nr:hypothetical protein [Tanacetum cinerariifolium]
MSDSDESGVTYTDISSIFEELLDIGSPRADDHEHLELPEMLEDPYVEVALQAPPSPDYIHGLEEPEHAPPSPDYVPGPEHADDEISDLEAHPEDDDDEDPEEDPVDYPADGGDDDDDEEGSSEDDEDDDIDIEANEEKEEHPALADSVVVALTAADQAPSAEETDPFETDESAATPPPHPAYRMTAKISIPALVPMPAREDRPEVTLPPRKKLGIAIGPGYEIGKSLSAAAARPAGGLRADYGFSTEETEPFETDESVATPPPHPAYRMTARISIPAPVRMPAWSDSEIVRLLAISSPPASPLSLWSSPPPQIPFLPLPPILSPPSPILSPAPPPSPIRSLGYRAAMIRLRAEATSTSHSPPLQLPSASRREDRPEVTLLPQKKLGIMEDRPKVTLPPRKKLGIALGPRYEVGESSSAAAARPAGGLRADYGFVATMDREIMRDPEREVGYGITDSWDEIVETLQGAPNPPYEFKWNDKVVPVTEGGTKTTTKRYMENYKNVSQDIRDQLNAKAEAIQIILTWIDNDIYSTVDACPNACEMWKAVKRLKQGESINVQDLKTNLYWEFGKFTSQDGKAIVNSPPPIYDQEPSMVPEDDEMSKDKDIDKLMALISLSFNKIYKPTNNNLRTSLNTSRANQDNSPMINRGTGYENQRICNVAGARENVAYHKEKMLLCKQEEAGFQFNVEQADWKDDTNDEPEDQELEAHYIEQVDQDDDDDLENERDLLASLIEKLKCEIDDSKNPSITTYLLKILHYVHFIILQSFIMTTLNVTSSTDSQMHNNIMAAGSRDHPPMLATGRYPQWRSWFLRYIDTRPKGEAIPEHTTVETPMNMTPENNAHFEAEKEAIHLILIGIGDEIYSTVDACQTAQEM